MTVKCQCILKKNAENALSNLNVFKGKKSLLEDLFAKETAALNSEISYVIAALWHFALLVI